MYFFYTGVSGGDTVTQHKPHCILTPLLNMFTLAWEYWIHKSQKIRSDNMVTSENNANKQTCETKNPEWKVNFWFVSQPVCDKTVPDLWPWFQFWQILFSDNMSEGTTKNARIWNFKQQSNIVSGLVNDLCLICCLQFQLILCFLYF